MLYRGTEGVRVPRLYLGRSSPMAQAALMTRDLNQRPPGDSAAWATSLPPIERMIGYQSIQRSFESIYAFVSRIIVANQLNQTESQKTIPQALSKAAFGVGQQDIPGAIAWLAEHGVSPEAARRRVDPRVWEPLPGFNSVAPECLRICPCCMELQFHTWAWSSDLISRCPVHEVPLTQSCPACGVRLLAKGSTLRKSAFCCPRECMLSAAIFGGLGTANEPGAPLLAQQFRWVTQVRNIVSVQVGLAHVAYPPYLAIANLRTPPQPSSGLTAAVLEQMSRVGVDLPRLLPWHDMNPHSWRVRVAPWNAALSGVPPERIEHARRSIRRTAYVTQLPIFDLASFRTWYDRTPAMWPWINLETLVLVSGDIVSISVESHLLIANELHALRQLLARHNPVDLAASVYQDVLFEILVFAVKRRAQLDCLQPSGEILCIAERVDAVLLAAGQFWKIVAQSLAAPADSDSWREYQEPAELGGGYVYLSNRSRRN